jgi:hypothetical protein
MAAPQHPDVAWLLTLRATERARFLALLAHELTVSGRLIAFPRPSADMRLQLEQLRQLNEIQHRVASYIGYALGPNEEVVWLPIVANYVLEPRDSGLREITTEAWNSIRRKFVPVA